MICQKRLINYKEVTLCLYYYVLPENVCFAMRLFPLVPHVQNVVQIISYYQTTILKNHLKRKKDLFPLASLNNTNFSKSLMIIHYDIYKIPCLCVFYQPNQSRPHYFPTPLTLSLPILQRKIWSQFLHDRSWSRESYQLQSWYYMESQKTLS